MATYTVNFKKVRRNADWRRTFTLMTAPDTPLDISTAAFSMDVKPKVGSNTPVLSLSLGSGLQLVTDGTDGKVMINVDKAAMANIADGSYKYDIRMTRGDADDIIFEGSVKFVSGVTD